MEIVFYLLNDDLDSELLARRLVSWKPVNENKIGIYIYYHSTLILVYSNRLFVLHNTI